MRTVKSITRSRVWLSWFRAIAFYDTKMFTVVEDSGKWLVIRLIDYSDRYIDVRMHEKHLDALLDGWR